MNIQAKKNNSYSRLLFLILIPLGFILYRDVLGAPFVYDDRGYIITNLWIRFLRNFLDLSGTRYIGFLSFALNYSIGGLIPFDYHLVNILIHIFNSMLVFFLIIKTFETPAVRLFFKERGDAQKVSLCLAFVSSVVFLSHPVESQAVSYITQRFASLAAFFYLSAILLYAKARLILCKTGEDKLPAGVKTKAWGLYLASFVSTVIAMKTKEISFTLPFAIVLYDFVFFGKEFKRGMKLRIPFYFTLFIIPLTILGPDLGIIGHNTMNEGLRGLELNEATRLSRSVYMLTELSVVVTYIRLLLFPVNQALDYDYRLSYSLFELRTLSSFIFLLSLFILTCFVLRFSRRKGNAWALFFSFGVLWFFLTLSVESALVPIQDVIFEQRVYLPSVGFIISFFSVLFYCVEYFARRFKIRISHVAVSALTLLLTLPPLSIALNKRNKLWCDEIFLLNDAISKNPKKGRLYYARGLVRFDRREYDEALTDANKAIVTIPLAYNLRGMAHSGMGKYSDSITDFSKALAFFPSSKIYMNRAIAYTAVGNYEKALEDLNESIVLSPGDRSLIKNEPFSRIYNELKLACDKRQMNGCDKLRKY